jgi:hypothetical protein
MPFDFFDRSPEEQKVVLIDSPTLREAERLIESCEHCHPEDAEIPFDWVLDKVTGRNGANTDYVMSEPARCPTCKLEVTERTLVDLRDEE